MRLRGLLVAQPLVVVDERVAVVRALVRDAVGDRGAWEVGSAMAETIRATDPAPDRPGRIGRHDVGSGGGPQRRPRRGGHRRRGAAGGRHLRERRVRLPRRRRRDSCARCATRRPSAACGSARRCPTSTARGSAGARLDVDPRRARASRWPTRSGRCSTIGARGRARRSSTSSRTARSTTASSTTTEQAAAVLAGSGDLPVLGLPGGRAAARWPRRRAGRTYREGFPDRGYRAEGDDGVARLLPRSEPGAVLEDPDEIARRAVDLAAGAASTRCACTVTAPPRSRPHAGCAPPWRRPATTLRGVRVRWLPAGPRRALARGRQRRPRSPRLYAGARPGGPRAGRRRRAGGAHRALRRRHRP